MEYINAKLEAIHTKVSTSIHPIDNDNVTSKGKSIHLFKIDRTSILTFNVIIYSINKHVQLDYLKHFIFMCSKVYS